MEVNCSKCTLKARVTGTPTNFSYKALTPFGTVDNLRCIELKPRGIMPMDCPHLLDAVDKATHRSSIR